ncbi:MAG: MBL fold metallo-hydrolase [Dehalococcoidia bacterium]|nr:MBL fold metallo-hydrolase [Dehalococcoidia bacterium]MDD5494544.1 MBL fold metallo-hydrolase [Dehalococcoidia bacterium]
MAGVKQQVIAVPSVYVNAFIVQGERSIIVDTGLPGFETKILETMERHDIKPADISLIVITHGHNDHYGSAAYLKGKTGAPVAVQRADVETLRTTASRFLYPVGIKGKVMNLMAKMVKEPVVQALEPDILVEDEMSLVGYGIAGRIIPIPGHTPGSLSIMLDGGCILIGDLIFGGLIRKQAPGFPYFCEDMPTLMKSIQTVLDLKPKIIYAGHGGPFTAASVRRRFFH